MASVWRQYGVRRIGYESSDCVLETECTENLDCSSKFFEAETQKFSMVKYDTKYGLNSNVKLPHCPHCPQCPSNDPYVTYCYLSMDVSAQNLTTLPQSRCQNFFHLIHPHNRPLKPPRTPSPLLQGTKSSSNRVHSNSSPKEVPKPSRRASFLSRFPGIRFTRTPPLESRPCSLQRDVVDAKPPRRGVEGDARSTESSIYRLNDQGLEGGEREGEGTFKKLDFEGEAFTSDGSLVGGDVCGSVVDEVVSIY